MDHERARAGVAYGLGAFLWWGCAVFYFKAIQHVSVAEILAHRIVWSALLLTGFLAASGRLRATVLAVREFRTAATLAGTTCLLACNWFIFVWAVGHDRVLETSMGYFIYPLVSVALGFIFLRERFRSLQLIGILQACLAVAILGVYGGRIPLVSLALAFSFSFYGLLRKKVKVDGVAGLAAETVFLSPLALSYMIYLDSADMLMFTCTDSFTDILLLSAGLVTAVPLVLFVNGARRLRYATIGVLQYTMPTITFLIAVFVFGEPFDSVQLIAFGTIWAAVVFYCADTVRESLRGNGVQAISTAPSGEECEEETAAPLLWDAGSAVRRGLEEEG
jgi:chloramphenicol-sensitive protein RarD